MHILKHYIVSYIMHFLLIWSYNYKNLHKGVCIIHLFALLHSFTLYEYIILSIFCTKRQLSNFHSFLFKIDSNNSNSFCLLVHRNTQKFIFTGSNDICIINFSWYCHINFKIVRSNLTFIRKVIKGLIFSYFYQNTECFQTLI